MKPIQVTIQKPEAEDWDKPYTSSHKFDLYHWNAYMIIEEVSKSNFNASLVMIDRPEDVELGDFKTLPEAQEACFQHYLKEIGEEI